MSYRSYLEQIHAHIAFLQSKGFDIEELKVEAGFIRCHQINKDQQRGELVYKTRRIKLNNGLTGIQTWYRGAKGETASFQTYGMGPVENEEVSVLKVFPEITQGTASQQHDDAARKAYGFWRYSETNGRSEYLERKKVGYYGIRFRSSLQYGDVAVVPMRDEVGRLWNYQLLNSDGTNRLPKEARTEGLFHMIGVAANGQPIGVAESYVTSASCFELTSIPTACAFSCQNLKSVAIILRQKYPESRLIIFADNDRHLQVKGGVNQGIIKGQEAIRAIEVGAVLVSPDFGSLEVSKGLSDWNDLVHQYGVDYAKAQIEGMLKGK
jgi:phage/plasmid primase-like uncharacterized protein